MFYLCDLLSICLHVFFHNGECWSCRALDLYKGKLLVVLVLWVNHVTNCSIWPCHEALWRVPNLCKLETVKTFDFREWFIPFLRKGTKKREKAISYMRHYSFWHAQFTKRWFLSSKQKKRTAATYVGSERVQQLTRVTLNPRPLSLNTLQTGRHYSCSCSVSPLIRQVFFPFVFITNPGRSTCGTSQRCRGPGNCCSDTAIQRFTQNSAPNRCSPSWSTKLLFSCGTLDTLHTETEGENSHWKLTDRTF